MNSLRQGGVRRLALWSILALLHALVPAYAQAPDPLPSWNDDPSKARSLAFVRAATDKSGKVSVKSDWKKILAFE